MSYDYSLIGIFSGEDPGFEAVKRAADAVGVDTDTVKSDDPRFFVDGLLVTCDDADQDEQALAHRTFGYENNLSLILADYSGSESHVMVRVMQKILRIALAFAEDPRFRGDLIDDFTDKGYLAQISDGALILDRTSWDSWDAAAEILSVVPQPHHFADLRISR